MSNSSIKCFDCNYGPIPLTRGDKAFFYLCENCGWGKIACHPFHIDGWYVELKQALAPIDVLQSLLTSEGVIEFLRPRLKGLSHLNTSLPNFNMGDDYYRGELDSVNKVYLSQMLVLCLTYAEMMIKDFYKCLFFEMPQRMNLVLSNDEKRAKIYLNEVLEASSKEELLERLVERAANKASSRRVDEIVSAFVKDCKLILSHPVVDDLKTLNEKRNKIVHEGSFQDVNVEQVLDGYGLVMYLLYVLSIVADRYNLPFVNEFDVLVDFNDELESQ